jgi:hypothetical protein
MAARRAVRFMGTHSVPNLRKKPLRAVHVTYGTTPQFSDGLSLVRLGPVSARSSEMKVPRATD